MGVIDAVGGALSTVKELNTAEKVLAFLAVLMVIDMLSMLMMGWSVLLSRIRK